jgi:glutathione S-transferase
MMLPHGARAYWTTPGAPNPRVVDMYAAELGVDLPSLERTVDLRSGENRGVAALRLNPSGGVPWLEFEDGTAISETVALCELLDEVSATTATHAASTHAPLAATVRNRAAFQPVAWRGGRQRGSSRDGYAGGLCPLYARNSFVTGACICVTYMLNVVTCPCGVRRRSRPYRPAEAPL